MNEKKDELDEIRERVKNIEKTLNELNEILTHRLIEIEKRIILIQREIKPITFEDVYDYIRDNIIVTKNDLLTQFPFLISRYNWEKFKKNLPDDIVLLYYPGFNWGIRFIHLYEKAIEYAIKYFNQTEFGKTIQINCPDPELKERIHYWLERIFGKLITKSTSFPVTYMKGVSVITRKGRRILKEKRK
ncbi:MAG: hypothetical protein QXL51_01255 [Candidatus Aenigmatarchaeota archaeon]